MQTHNDSGPHGWDDWADFYDGIYAGRTEDIPFYIEEIEKAGRSVLELGCGTGRVAIPMAKAGLDVTGLDASPTMLRKLRENRERAGTLRGPLRLIQGNMRKFALERKFDAVIIPARSFQMLLTPRAQRECLRAAHANLSPNGVLIFDLVSPTAYLGLVPGEEQDLKDPNTGRTFTVWSHDATADDSQIYQTTVAIQEHLANGTKREPVFRTLDLHYSHPQQVRAVLKFAGFDEETLYGDFHRSPYEPESTEMVWVAHRTTTLRD